jgi:hypothetical protein
MGPVPLGYRWWGRSLSHTRHQPRWADDEDRRFEVGPEAGTVPSGRAQPVGGLALSSPPRCAFGLRDSRRCIFGLEAGSRKVETVLASHPTLKDHPPDNVEPIPMTYSIYCMGQD